MWERSELAWCPSSERTDYDFEQGGAVPPPHRRETRENVSAFAKHPQSAKDRHVAVELSQRRFPVDRKVVAAAKVNPVAALAKHAKHFCSVFRG